MERLKRRPDFVAAAKASSVSTAGFVLQARDRGDHKPPRVGFTATKRLGGAVERNRIKRRLREVVRLGLESQAHDGFDYVLIGRAAGRGLAFAKLQDDLSSALKRLHGKPHEAADRERP